MSSPALSKSCTAASVAADDLVLVSYGYGKVYIVPHEIIDGQPQGGMCEFPIPQFPTGVMRGRFNNSGDGQLYLCGMSAWGSNQRQAGGLYRLRYTGQPVHLPGELKASEKEMTISFTGKLDSSTASDAKNYRVKVWNLKRTKNYGSKHLDVRELEIRSVSLDSDGQTVRIELPDLEKTWSMEIVYRLKSAGGKTFEGKIHGTVHRTGKR